MIGWGRAESRTNVASRADWVISAVTVCCAFQCSNAGRLACVVAGLLNVIIEQVLFGSDCTDW